MFVIYLITVSIAFYVTSKKDFSMIIRQPIKTSHLCLFIIWFILFVTSQSYLIYRIVDVIM